MKKFKIILFSLVCLSLAGCSMQKDLRQPGRIVTQVDIYCQKPSGSFSRRYTDPNKIEAVLHCIRLWDPIVPAQVPQEAMQEDLYEIVVHLQNGTHRIHRQRSGSYAALHRQPWGQIDGYLGLRLPFLMALLPSDNVDAENTDIPEKDVQNRELPPAEKRRQNFFAQIVQPPSPLFCTMCGNCQNPMRKAVKSLAIS